MGVGSGIGSQLGVGVETVYGTYQAPGRFYEATKATVTKVKNTKDWDGLAAGRLLNRADGRAVTSKGSAVAVDSLVVANRDMGILLNLIFGGIVAPTSLGGVPEAFQQLHPLKDNAGNMATFQSGVPLVGGASVTPQSALGCKVVSAEFACGVDDLLTVTLAVDGRDLTEAQPLAAASYGTPRRPFHFGQMGVKLGADVAGVAAVPGVRKVTVKIERGLDVGQFYANNGGLKDQPTTNDKIKVTGSFDVDYKVAADFADRYRDDEQAALVWDFTGPTISGANNELFSLEVPALFLDGDTPSVSGPDVVKTTFPFTAYDDLVSGYGVQATYVSQDSAL